MSLRYASGGPKLRPTAQPLLAWNYVRVHEVHTYVSGNHFASTKPLPGDLCGMHTLDLSDHLLKAPTAQVSTLQGRAGPVCGERGIATARIRDCPSASLATSFLETSWEGWRRLECHEPPTACLTSLPADLGVLSLQVTRLTLLRSAHFTSLSCLFSCHDYNASILSRQGQV